MINHKIDQLDERNNLLNIVSDITLYDQGTYYMVVKAGKKWFKVDLAELLSNMAIKVSKSEAKRLIDQGAVKIGIGI